MKKVITVALLLIFILFSFIPATGTTTGSKPLFIARSNVPAPRGGTVEVPVYVSGNASPGFAAATLVITFDPDVLTLIRIDERVSELPVNRYQPSTERGIQWISLVNESEPKNWTSNGDVIILVFNVANNAPVGTTFPVTLHFSSAPHADGTPAVFQSTGADILRNVLTPEWGSVIITETSPTPTPPGGNNPTPTPPGGNNPTPTPPGGGNNPTPTPTLNPNATASPIPSATPSPGPGSGGSGSGTGGSGSGGNGNNYGNVPQTSTLDITGGAVAMSVSITLTLILSVCLYLHIKTKRRRDYLDRLLRESTYGK